MSPRTGRPPSKDPKKHETRIRMSDEDVEILEYCCRITGKSKVDVIREGIREVGVRQNRKIRDSAPTKVWNPLFVREVSFCKYYNAD